MGGAAERSRPASGPGAAGSDAGIRLQPGTTRTSSFTSSLVVNGFFR